MLWYNRSVMFDRGSIRDRLTLLLVGIVVCVFFFASLMFGLHERNSMRRLYATLYETLSAFSRSGITALKLSYTSSAFPIEKSAGNDVRLESRVTFADGAVRSVYDVWFAYQLPVKELFVSH